MTNTIERMARIIDPDVWNTDLPVPTRTDTVAFHARRQKSAGIARAILDELRGLTTSMTAQEFFALVASMHKSKPDSHALSLGEWETDPVLGQPHMRFNAQIKVTMGEVRQMAQQST